VTSPSPLVRHMDVLFQRPDPWGYRTSPYEARKRAVTLACLPQARYTSGFEPGCANGVLSEPLLARCEQLLCADASRAALNRAAEQVGMRPGLSWRQMTIPQEWPDQPLDLIVLSELLYYLDAEDCLLVAQHCVQTLRPGGTVLACHWRQTADDFLISGEAAHDGLRQVFDASGVVQHTRLHRETDFQIDVWTRRDHACRVEGPAP
jgi:SAM-dependent methyltransferase